MTQAAERTIKILKPVHASQYEDVQKLSLQSARNFHAKPETYKWYVQFEKYPTLGVFHGDLLISVMRLEWITSWHELNAKMNSNIFISAVQFPVAYLTKAGTRPEFMSLGLNSLLRYHAIKISQYWPVDFLLGTMINGSPRVETMIKMGYEFQMNTVKWQGAYQSDENALIGFLNLKAKAEFALSYLENNYSDLIKNYQVDFEHRTIGLDSRN